MIPLEEISGLHPLLEWRFQRDGYHQSRTQHSDSRLLLVRVLVPLVLSGHVLIYPGSMPSVPPPQRVEQESMSRPHSRPLKSWQRGLGVLYAHLVIL